MKKLFTMFACIAIFAIRAFGQSDAFSAQVLAAKLDQYSARHLHEKAYLQFDKPYYAAGDTIYFKAYITASELHKPSTISGVLHVDLVSPGNRVNQSLVLQLYQGLAWGDFALPDSLTKGNYRIRAYTKWMLNDKEGVFDQVLPVGSVNSTVYENASPQSQFKADVQFFPEGGELVTDIRSRIAFKAIGNDGLGTDVKGYIIDNNNKPVASFASTHLGMGVISLLPEEGKTYRARYKLKDSITHYINLPVPVTKGAVVSVRTGDPQKVSVSIKVNHNYYNENQNKNLLLTIYSGGQLTHVSTKLDTWEMNLDLPVNKFTTGIARFTVFSPTGEPLCERLAFLQNPDEVTDLGISADKTAYNRRELTRISLNAHTPLGSSKGHYSIAVIDEGKLPGGNAHSSIMAYLLLTSELKGYVEDPDYYFSSANPNARFDLDALMLTQGYRKFTWKQLMTETSPVVNPYQAEKSLDIAGTLLSTTSNKPAADGTVTLVPPHGGPFLTAQTDADGCFKFSGLLFADSVQFLFNGTDKFGGNKVKVKLDPPPPPLAVEPLNEPAITTPDMQTYVQYVRKDIADRSLNVQMKGKVLKEVKVQSYRSANIVGSGHADQVVDMTKIKSQGSLDEVLYGVLSGVYFKNGAAYLSGFNSGPMLTIVDGIYYQASADTSRSLPNNFSMGLSNLSAGDIETVEVLKYANASIYGIGAGNGVLVITTKQGKGRGISTELAPGITPLKVAGFYRAREFYTPAYQLAGVNANKLHDQRSTIYWQPELVTDDTGKASFSYYNADGTGTYRVLIEGMDENGHLAHAVYRYTVK